MNHISSLPVAAHQNEDAPSQHMLGGQIVEEAMLRTFLAYWESRCKAGLPARRDIDPIDIPRLLSRLMLVDVRSAGVGFDVRLAGTWLNNAYGRELSGTSIDAGSEHGGSDSIMRRLLRHTVRHRAPVYGGGYWMSARGLWLEGRGLAAPLSEDGTTVTGVVTCLSDFTYASDQKPIDSGASFTMVLGQAASSSAPLDGHQTT